MVSVVDLPATSPRRRSSTGSPRAESDALDADHLAVSVRTANWDLRAHVERDPALQGMATTFTGLFVSHAGTLLLAHTGDSRAYRLRDGVLTQQTRDDSLVQVLVDRGLARAGGCGIPPPSQHHHGLAQRR